MKRAILTGATGFIGANLARRLLQAGHEVHLLVRPNYAPWRIAAIRGDVRLYEVSFSDPEGLDQVISDIRPDWVFHLAVHGAYASQSDVRQIVDTNILGTINLIQACLKAGFEAFVNTGSSSEYGFKDHAPSEREWLEPNSYYAVTKASATLFCRYSAQSRGMHMPTLRLYSVYGPYEEPTRLMPTLILHGLKAELPPLVGPDIARDYIYIDDVTEAYLLAAAQPGQEIGAVYNLGTGIQTSLREVVEIARRRLRIPVEPVWGSMPNRQWDTHVWIADNREIREHLKWRPTYTFEQGFHTMVNWFAENPALLRRYYERQLKGN
jgi:nucleoside-diphosphate-sugar epimerase